MNNFFIFCEIIFLLVLVAYLVNLYSLKKNPTYIKALVYTAWLMSFSFICIVPLDLYVVFFIFIYMFLRRRN